MSTITDYKPQHQKWRFDKEHKIWRQQYRSRRYLEYMTFKELVRRAEDVMLNSLTLNRELKVGLYPTDAEAGYWAEMFTHILEECVLRNFHYRELLKELDPSITPKYNWPGLQEAVSKVGKSKLQTGNFLIKYGKEQYLRPMLDTGSVRISPASFYDDPSLNSAIRDTELELTVYSLSSEVTLTTLDPITREEIGQIETEGYIQRSRYAYQKEYRVVWLPPTSKTILDPVFLELGNLHETAN